jgi:hypothetical protein
MATTLPQKFKLRISRNAKFSFKPVVSGRFGRLRKSNNVEFVRYCGGHFENGER